MKHLKSLAIIIAFGLCLYISIASAKNAAARPAQMPNQPSINPEIPIESFDVKSSTLNLEPNGEWQVLLSEGFEGAWPSSGWSVTDLSGDGYDRKWGTDDYRSHSPGQKAAWPARSGRNGRDPTSRNNDYFSNMDTRMVYGPFDLSDAGTLEVSFWMWWQTEANQDVLILEVSRDNLIFDEIGRWSGTSSGWQQIDLTTEAYAADSSVWVAWHFTSNASNVFDGPWVDDITLKKIKFWLCYSIWLAIL